MLGGAASFMFFMLVLFVLSIWILVRIWRRSPLLAILSFLFWPVTIFALISCWGDEESCSAPTAPSTRACRRWRCS
jgi:hypothetical protein